jgi:hypothetical protein
MVEPTIRKPAIIIKNRRFHIKGSDLICIFPTLRDKSAANIPIADNIIYCLTPESVVFMTLVPNSLMMPAIEDQKARNNKYDHVIKVTQNHDLSKT